MARKKPPRKGGLASKKDSRWGLRGKTVWDWLQLLVVPLMLALITVVFTWQQNIRQNELEDQRTRQAQRIEDQRAEAERKLAEQRAQDEALQAYLDQMSTLLLERNLRSSEEDSEVRTLAQARTLTVLGRLDPNQRTQLMEFLLEAALVQRVDERDPIIALADANLSGANLSGTALSGADLSEANLSGANLSGANLSSVDLREANLSGAELIGATLKGAELIGADLSRAFLIDADLSGVDLTGADLSYAVISALGVSNKQLDEQAANLEGAFMPNGQKYEDWLKSKGRGQDGENSGPS